MSAVLAELPEVPAALAEPAGALAELLEALLEQAPTSAASAIPIPALRTAGRRL
jgi:hypothetical protein